MKKNEIQYMQVSSQSEKSLVKLCHCCGHLHEAVVEVDRCIQCKKSFLPAKYFEKIHDLHQNYLQLFSKVEELDENDLIKGLMIIW